MDKEGKVVYFIFSVCFKITISLPSLVLFSLCMCVFVESLSLWHGSVASMKLSSDLLCALFQCFVLSSAFMFTRIHVLVLGWCGGVEH